MDVSRSNYEGMLKKLLPPGKAWGGNIFKTLLSAFAAELHRIHEKTENLYVEALPRSTSELLPDWERVADLPWSCVGDGFQTETTRRNELIARITATGGQSVAYIKSVALKLGYEIDIVEFKVARAGRLRAGERLCGVEWGSAFEVLASVTPAVGLTVGSGAVGDPLTFYEVSGLQCLIASIKPAHTYAIFKTVNVEFRAGMRAGRRLRQIA